MQIFMGFTFFYILGPLFFGRLSLLLYAIIFDNQFDPNPDGIKWLIISWCIGIFEFVAIRGGFHNLPWF